MRFSIKHSSPLGIVLIVLAVAVAVGAARMTRETLVLRSELRDARKRLEEIAQEKGELARRLEEQDRPEAVEYRAKATLNLKRPEEEVVVVVPEERPAAVVPSPGVWRRVRDFFGEMF